MSWRPYDDNSPSFPQRNKKGGARKPLLKKNVTIQLVSAVKRSRTENTFRSFSAGVLPASEASATSCASCARSRTNPRKAFPVRELPWVAVLLDSYKKTCAGILSLHFFPAVSGKTDQACGKQEHGGWLRDRRITTATRNIRVWDL